MTEYDNYLTKRKAFDLAAAELKSAGDALRTAVGNDLQAAAKSGADALAAA